MNTKKILNWNELSVSKEKTIILDIIEAGLETANPYSSVLNTLTTLSKEIERFRKIVVIGFGKASYRMALACEKVLGERISDGAIIVPKGSVKFPELKKIRLLEGTHPVPTEINVNSARTLLEISKGLSSEDLVICLISGGGSALFTYPAEGITLEDKQEMTRLLLAVGSTIQEINCIRKHISGVKGGQLARHVYPANLLSLILSDVVGDDLSSIASGPTSPDPYTFKDVYALFEKYHLVYCVAKNIMERVMAGLDGRVQDTPK
ncbi:MAG: glycerate-2-kinase family protein, partial [Nitrososphaeria archaeon]|nr:glycerate-2-kinase family protein [Nitrososphaeria archaeon]